MSIIICMCICIIIIIIVMCIMMVMMVMIMTSNNSYLILAILWSLLPLLVALSFLSSVDADAAGGEVSLEFARIMTADELESSSKLLERWQHLGWTQEALSWETPIRLQD